VVAVAVAVTVVVVVAVVVVVDTVSLLFNLRSAQQQKSMLF
jgi:hypothetical protein